MQPQSLKYNPSSCAPVGISLHEASVSLAENVVDCFAMVVCWWLLNNLLITNSE